MGRTPEIVKSAPAPECVSDATAAQKGAMLAWVQAIAPYGIFTTDTELKIRTWNQWLVTHSGLRPDEVIGRPLIEVFPNVSERKLDEHFRRALAGEVSVLSTALHKYLLPLRSTVRTVPASEMLQTARIAPLVFSDQTVGTIATIEDVTQRESHALVLRRQQEHDRLLSTALALLLASDNPLQVAAQLFPNLAAPLRLEVYFNYLLTPDGSELRLHAAGGITPEVKKSMAVVKVGEGHCGTSALGRKPIYIPSVQESTDPQAQVMRRLGLAAYAAFPLLIGERLLGTLSFGSYQRQSIAPDEIEFLFTVAQYLALAIDRAMRENALREAQKELSEHAEILETKIAERTAKLHETIVQLESFSYTIAHDLRAPIRSLKGFSEILLNDYGDSMPDPARAMLARLSRASHRLDVLTRDLLEFSRIVQQDVKLSPVDVAELVREIIIVTPALQEGVLSLPASLGIVQAQRTLLQQCLTNLFDNALKFARPGIPPRISVRAEGRGAETMIDFPATTAAFASPMHAAKHPQAAGPMSSAPWPTHGGAAPRIRIWIEDNGIGIPLHAHEKIFGIFERVSGNDQIEGTGIGLAIVARAMQQMGGACGVESGGHDGSRFWLEFAAAQ
jgi:PAS domain S-box-containing protein